MYRILVLGGTGFLGRSVCEKLVERSAGGDGPITVATHRPNRAGHIQMLPTVDVVRADVHDNVQLARLVAGRDAVINLVGILHGSEADFQRVHVELPKRLARACEDADVVRVLHVSALGADAQAPSRYLRSKAAGEMALRRALLDVTLFRPSVMFGQHDHFMNLFARLQAVFPVLPLAGAEARFQPVWVDNVAAAIVRALDDPSSSRETLEFTGPTVYTLRQLVKLAGRWSGHERAVLALPDFLGRVQAAAMELLPGEPLLSRDNLDSMKVPSVASGKLPGLARLGIAPNSLEGVMPLLLSRRGGPARFDPWRAFAGRG